MLSEQFAFHNHALVNFVGGGGKTALIHRLMNEYAGNGTALCTTTTRLHPPAYEEGFSFISGVTPSLLRQALERIGRTCTGNNYKIVAAGRFMSANLALGVPTDFISLMDRKLFPVFLNEADGAAGFSLKLYRENEPVLMSGAEYLVPVIGIDCIGKTLGPDTALRWRELSQKFALREGDLITPQLASAIFMHPHGACRDWNPGTKIIPFINKVDSEALEPIAKNLAGLILNNGNFPVERVLIGSALNGSAVSITASENP